MKILINSLLFTTAFFLNFGNSSSQGESPRGSRSRSRFRSRSPSPLELDLSLRPPGRRQANQTVLVVRSQGGTSRPSRSRTPSPLRLQLSLGEPIQSANQSVPISDAQENEASGSRSQTTKFRVSGYHPPPVLGPANAILWYKHKRIELVLDPTKTKIMRADFPGNIVPHGNFFLTNSFLCRQAKIGILNLVVYIADDGSLMGVRAPISTTSNVMEPDERTWFVVHRRKYFRVKQNPQTRKAESISLIPENLQSDGDRFTEQEVGGFKFIMFRKQGWIAGAALPPGQVQ